MSSSQIFRYLLLPLCLLLTPPAIAKPASLVAMGNAEHEFRIGNYNQVLVLLANARNIPDLILKGRAQFWKTYEIECFIRAVQAAPTNSSALCWRGYPDLVSKHFRDAEPWLEQAVNRDHNNAEALSMFGYCLMKEGEPQRGKALIAKALSLKNQSEVVLEFAAKACESQLDIKGAEDLYDQLIHKFPDMARAWDLKAQLYLQEGKLTEAESCFKKALATNPRFEDSIEHLANLLLRQNRFQESISSATTCIKLKSQSGCYYGCFRLRALAYEGIHSFKLASEDWTSFLHQPRLLRPGAHSQQQEDALLALCADYRALGNYSAALETNERSLALRPSGRRARIERAKIYEAMGNFSKAKEIYDKLIAEDNTVSDIYRARAKVLRALSLIPAATADEKKAKSLDE